MRAFELDPFLALPDVNPQITDNELVTEALLRVEVETDAQEEAPRIYSEPTRVASLLLPSQETGTDAAVSETAVASTVEEAEISDENATLRSLGVEAEQRQLRSDDLRAVDAPTTLSPEEDALLESRRNDVRESFVDEPATRSSSAPEPEAEEEATEAPSRTLSIQDLSTTRVNQAGTSAGGGSARRSNARGSATSNRRPTSTNRRSTTSRPRSTSPTRFRPGRRSSAQLDLRLVPQPAPATPAPARD